jgi:hypothetical protein
MQSKAKRRDLIGTNLANNIFVSRSCKSGEKRLQCRNSSNYNDDMRGSLNEGMKFLCSGTMSYIRNRTAHARQHDLNFSEQDAIAILHFISFLMREIDNNFELEQ